MNDNIETIDHTDDLSPVEIPVNGVLDLHTFRPSEVKYLVEDYLTACLEKNILSVRIIHGKGIGNLRRTVHSVLSKISFVKSYSLAPETAGSWGATLVELIIQKKLSTKNNI
ncbi:MAG: Smr/MutS family protein [Candidatus Riflebacteria bacterium]|nr:Smr/MutS family protein [Candidatus Riflebacteria bacterium]